MAKGRRVWSARALRSTAWVSAAAAFVASWGVLGTLPPPSAPVRNPTAPGKVIVLRKILRRVIVHEDAPAAPPPNVTWTPAPSAPTGGSVTSTGGSAP